MSYLLIILLIISTKISGKIGIHFGLSEVVGQLLAGIFLGGSLLNLVQPTSTMHWIAETGVFLLMLNSGLESNLKEMKKYVKSSSLIAIMGVIVPMITFPVVFFLLSYSIVVSLFAGIVFSATSISITLAVLAEQKKLATAMGTIIVSAAILDDIIALLAVTIFSVFVGSGTLGISSLLPLMGFIIGMLLKKFNFSDNVVTVTTRVGNLFFYPVFFGSIGLGIDIQRLDGKVMPIIIFSILAILTKFSGSLFGARLSGLSREIANAIGAGMISRGEMALVIVQIGISANLINDITSAEFVVTVIISTIVAPIMMKPLFAKV